MRGARMGTLGRSPPENTRSVVAASPNQDAFAVGVDLCFILAHPSKKGEDINMWTHSVRGTPVAAGGGSVGRACDDGCAGGVVHGKTNGGAMQSEPWLRAVSVKRPLLLRSPPPASYRRNASQTPTQPASWYVLPRPLFHSTCLPRTAPARNLRV